MKYIYLIERNAYDYNIITNAFSSYQFANEYLTNLFKKLEKDGDYDSYQLKNDSIIAYFEGCLIESLTIKKVEITK